MTKLLVDILKEIYIFFKEEDINKTINILRQEGYADEPAESACGIVTQRFLIWRLVKAGQGATASYFSFFINVKNPTGTGIGEVTLNETIPPEVASHVKRVSFTPDPDSIISPAPPIVEWKLEDFNSGADVNLNYIVNGLSDKSVFDRIGEFFKSMSDPAVTCSQRPEKFACSELDCDDGNICTKDSCSGPECKHTPRPGLSCGPNMVCNADADCEQRNLAPDIVLPEIKLPAFEDLAKGGIIVTVLVAWVFVSLLFVFYRRRKPRHPWGFGGP